jgi:peptide/nickel transport system ATP-binding protein
MGSICEAKLLIVEEPMTTLDVMVQYQIIGLLRRLSGRTGMALRFIT